MANLAKTRKPIGARTQGTRNRATTVPNRAETRVADRQVNAPLTGGNSSEAEKLASILGVAKQAGSALVDLRREEDVKDRAAARTQAALDASTGAGPADMGGTAGRAYSNAYFGFQAQEQSIAAATRAEEKVTALLNDPEAKPDLDDLSDIINAEFSGVAMDEDGALRYSDLPDAQRAMAGILSESRTKLMAAGMKAIKAREDLDLISAAARSYTTQLTTPPAPSQNLVPQPGDVMSVEVEPSEYASDSKKATVLDTGMGAPVPIQTTGRLPFGDRSAITNNHAQHRQRGSNGVDIDGRIGDPIETPADAKVLKVAENGPSGKYVILSHGRDAAGNEITSSYSHLNDFNVVPGQTLPAGSIIGAMGNTGRVSKGPGGDGSHLHWRVKVNGADADPLTFDFSGTRDGSPAEALEGIEEIDIEFATAKAEGAIPVVNVEDFYKSLPPGIDKKQAKTVLMDHLVSTASEQSRPHILEGAAQSLRDDGTPSWTPAEQQDLRDEARRIRTQARQDREQARAERWQKADDQLILAIANGQRPSLRSLREAANAGEIDPQRVLWTEQRYEAEDEKARIRADRAQAEAHQQREARVDAYVAGLAVPILLGRSHNLNEGDVERMFRTGKLGTDEFGNPSVGALRNASTLRSAIASGAAARNEDPLTARAIATLENSFRPDTAGTGFSDLFGGGGSNSNPNARVMDVQDYSYMMSLVTHHLEEGKTGPEAVRIAQQWGLDNSRLSTDIRQRTDSDLSQREAELAAKASGAR